MPKVIHKFDCLLLFVLLLLCCCVVVVLLWLYLVVVVVVVVVVLLWFLLLLCWLAVVVLERTGLHLTFCEGRHYAQNFPSNCCVGLSLLFWKGQACT